MTSSKAFRCVQAWLREKPAAWTDDPCLAAAQMAQRPPTKRPREDALLEAERSHQRRRIELLNKHLLGEEAEVRRLEQCFAAAALQAPATRSQRAELALRWFEAHDTWGGKWDAWDVVLDHGGPPEPPARPKNQKGGGSLGPLCSLPVHHLFRPPLQEALICMLYRSSVPADCCTSPGIKPPKAPKCSFAIPPGGTEKSRRAVLQTPCEAVPRKVPVTPT